MREGPSTTIVSEDVNAFHAPGRFPTTAYAQSHVNLCLFALLRFTDNLLVHQVDMVNITLLIDSLSIQNMDTPVPLYFTPLITTLRVIPVAGRDNW